MLNKSEASLPHSASGLQEDTEQDEGNTYIKREINLATLAKDEECEDNGVAGLEIIRQIDGKG